MMNTSEVFEILQDSARKTTDTRFFQYYSCIRGGIGIRKPCRGLKGIFVFRNHFFCNGFSQCTDIRHILIFGKAL